MQNSDNHSKSGDLKRFDHGNKYDKKGCFIPDGKGGKVEVSEAVYRFYWQSEWSESKRRQRSYRCRDGNGIRCKKDCSLCPFSPTGNAVSLDGLFDDSEFEPKGTDSIEDLVLLGNLLEELDKVLEELDPKGRRIAQMIKEGKSEKEMMSIAGYARQSSFNSYKKRLLAKLNDRLKDFI